MPLTLALFPRAGRGKRRRCGDRPSPRLRGEGAGRRMRGKFGLAIVSGHPPLSLRDISPSRGEIGTSWSIKGALSAFDCPGTIDCRRRSSKRGMLNERPRVPLIQSPPLRGRCPAGQRGVSRITPFPPSRDTRTPSSPGSSHP
ncbi:hypothetical protein C0075_04740 [Rhizobium sp. KAs_5_22]|nr:hypothetical protein C0075_04740 [Rhizobium sp. KAs_5_22]